MAPVGFEGFLLSAELGGETGQLPLPRREGERVNLLWTTPVTAAEQAFAMAEEGGGMQLVTLLQQEGASHIFRPRQQVVEQEA